MRSVIINITILLIGSLAVNAMAKSLSDLDARTASTGGEYTQSIHVVNLLANGGLPDPGMTRTPVIVKYYNGSSWPCWTYTLNYQDDYTIHTGPTQGCVNKVNQVVITPMLVAEKLNTYRVPDTVMIDTTKYSSHVVVAQAKAPVFDSQSGLVALSGDVKVNVQTDPQ